MRLRILLALALIFSLGATARAQSSPYSNVIFRAQTFTATGQTGTPIQLNGLVVASTVGSSFASGTITVTGSSLTTVTFGLQGSSDGGATYYALPVSTVASPTTTPTTTITATGNGLYQVNLAGLTHVRFVTSGTFTATNVSLTLTASPNASIARNQSGGGGSGGSETVKYVSQLGCAQNGSWDTRTGTDAGPCISAALATATATNRVVVIQDGVSAISQITGPSSGNWTLSGLGGGWQSVNITNCSITGNVATFTTVTNTLTAGKILTVGGFTTCTALNNKRVTVNSSGLSSTSFTVNFTTANVASTAESGTAAWLTGTGFIQLAASNDIVGPIHTTGNTGCGTGIVNALSEHGNNVTLSNFVIDGNSDASANAQGNFCYQIYIEHMNHVIVDHVLSYSPDTFNSHFFDVDDLKVDGFTALDAFPKIDLYALGLVFKDGIHLSGNVSNVNISNFLLKTNDDAIAINAYEVFGDPITNVNVTGGTIFESNSAMRLLTCGVTTISHVHFVNVNVNDGYGHIGYLGNQCDSAGTKTIDDFTWSDSTVASPQGFDVSDSFKSMTLSNFKWRMTTGPIGNSQGEWFIIPNYVVNMDFLSFQNVTQEVDNGGIFGGAIGLSRGTGAGSGFFVNNFYIDQFNETCGLAPSTPASCGLPMPSFINTGASALAITNLTAGIVSNANITTFVAGGVASTTPVTIPGFTSGTFPCTDTSVGAKAINCLEAQQSQNSFLQGFTMYGLGTYSINCYFDGVSDQYLDSSKPCVRIVEDETGGFIFQKSAASLGAPSWSTVASIDTAGVLSAPGAILTDTAGTPLQLSSSSVGSTAFVISNPSFHTGNGWAIFEAGSSNGTPGAFGYFNYLTSHQPFTLLQNDDVLLTGALTSPLYKGPSTAPSGSCSVIGWAFTQDGHASFCNGTTWALKI